MKTSEIFLMIEIFCALDFVFRIMTNRIVLYEIAILGMISFFYLIKYKDIEENGKRKRKSKI